LYVSKPLQLFHKKQSATGWRAEAKEIRQQANILVASMEKLKKKTIRTLKKVFQT
jgi:hypothetical protein